MLEWARLDKAAKKHAQDSQRILKLGPPFSPFVFFFFFFVSLIPLSIRSCEKASKGGFSYKPRLKRRVVSSEPFSGRQSFTPNLCCRHTNNKSTKLLFTKLSPSWVLGPSQVQRP